MAPPIKRRKKVETRARGPTRGSKVSDSFIEELAETCAEPGEVMTSPALQEASARMLEMTGGEWHKDYPIPMASGENNFTSYLAWYCNVFPYRWNISVVVIAMMDKNH